RVDHQPALRIGRADELDDEALPRGTRAAVAGDDVVRFNRGRARWRPDRERNAVRVLNEVGRLMAEGDPDRRESRKPPEQRPLEVGLVECAERRMAVEPAR